MSFLADNLVTGFTQSAKETSVIWGPLGAIAALAFQDATINEAAQAYVGVVAGGTIGGTIASTTIGYDYGAKALGKIALGLYPGLALGFLVATSDGAPETARQTYEPRDSYATEGYGDGYPWPERLNKTDHAFK